MAAAGHAGTPLARQLDLRDGQRVWFEAMPEAIADEIDEYALDLIFVARPDEGIDAAHVFVTDRTALADRLGVLRTHIAADGHIWVSWPCPAEAQLGEFGEDAIHAAAQPLGLVATKSLALEAGWEAIKLVVRKALR